MTPRSGRFFPSLLRTRENARGERKNAAEFSKGKCPRRKKKRRRIFRGAFLYFRTFTQEAKDGFFPIFLFAARVDNSLDSGESFRLVKAAEGNSSRTAPGKGSNTDCHLTTGAFFCLRLLSVAPAAKLPPPPRSDPAESLESPGQEPARQSADFAPSICGFRSRRTAHSASVRGRVERMSAMRCRTGLIAYHKMLQSLMHPNGLLLSPKQGRNFDGSRKSLSVRNLTIPLCLRKVENDLMRERIRTVGG